MLSLVSQDTPCLVTVKQQNSKEDIKETECSKPNETNKSIFSNNFSLSFAKDSIQRKYENNLYFGKFVPKVIFLVLILAIHLGLLITYFVKKEDLLCKIHGKILKGMSYFILALEAACIVLFILREKHLLVSKIYQYSIFMAISMVLSNIAMLVGGFIKDEVFRSYEYYIYIFEFSLKLIYIISVDCEFIKIFIINALIISGTWISLLSMEKQSKTHIISLSNLTYSYCIFTFFSYFLDKFIKKIYYFTEKCDMQKNFYFSLLDNMVNGIIVYNVDKKKVKYLNKYLKQFDEFSQIIKSNENSNEGSISEKEFKSFCEALDIDKVNAKFKAINLFNQIFDVNKDLPEEVQNYLKMGSFSESAEELSKFYNTGMSNEFYKKPIYLGNISLNQNYDENLFEFYLKWIKKDFSDSVYFEIMLNNVTYTKTHEQEKTKAKTKILAKVSHEFKTPLIVVSEVAEEVNEEKEEKSNLKFNFRCSTLKVRLY